MYLPPQFREDRLTVQHDLIRHHPLGLLVTAAAGGLMANPIPFVLDASASPNGTLRAHLSRANPQVSELAGGQQCLVVFQGPQDYITPSWYATKRETGRVVPTWNYATVHAWGCPRLIDDAELRRQLQALTQHQEAARAHPWHVADAPDDFIAAQMKGIVGFEMVIDRIEGKWKVSQNRPEADRQGVLAGLSEQGEEAQDMMELIARYGNLRV